MLNIHQLEHRITHLMNTHQVPGLALAIVKGDAVIYARGIGHTRADEYGLPITPQTLFRVASLTKGMTATLILRLVEAGKLDLSTPITTYLPTFHFEQQPDYTAQITLQMLLSHTSGLPSSYAPAGYQTAKGLRDYVYEQLAHLPFLAPPGLLFNYSNPGFRLAGYIAEVVMGVPYADLMQAYVFDPLEMTNTTFDPLRAMMCPLALPHNLAEDASLSVQPRFTHDVGGYPSGGVISNVLDMANYMMMHLNSGRFADQQLLQPNTIDLMHSQQIRTYNTKQGGYALGLDVEPTVTKPQIGHDGLIASYTARVSMLPHEKVGVMILNNRGFSFWDPIYELIQNIFYDIVPDYAPHIAQPIQHVPPTTHSGFFVGAERGLVQINLVAQKLHLIWNGREIDLYPLEADLYYGGDEENGWVAVGFVTVDYILLNGFPCQRQPRLSVHPLSETELTLYIGHYQGPDDLTFWVQAGELMAYSMEYDQTVPCLPLGNHRFACDLGMLQFAVDEDGQITGLQLGLTYPFWPAAAS